MGWKTASELSDNLTELALFQSLLRSWPGIHEKLGKSCRFVFFGAAIERQHVASRTAAYLHAYRVDHNRRQPSWHLRASLEISDVGEGRKQGVLNRVFGVFVIAQP